MQVLVFVTKGDAGNPTGPTLFLADRPAAILPEHPRALEWTYFATIQEGDDLLAHAPGAVQVLTERGFYIANRMI